MQKNLVEVISFTLGYVAIKTNFIFNEIYTITLKRKTCENNKSVQVFIYFNRLLMNMNNLFEKLKNNIHKKSMNMKNGSKY
jgi:hypothetical protein